jgi:hypothetical protein
MRKYRSLEDRAILTALANEPREVDSCVDADGSKFRSIVDTGG